MMIFSKDSGTTHTVRIKHHGVGHCCLTSSIMLSMKLNKPTDGTIITKIRYTGSIVLWTEISEEQVELINKNS